MERARSLDRGRAAHPAKPFPKLFGLPISLKDSFNVPGVDATIGFICFANDKSTKHSVLCDMLLEQGAVFYCKTNIPQTLMTADSDNNVFGRCLNPHNTSLTAGGSTGGEGALIAMRGSIVGIGTDIAGSIRIPAHCNGTYGFKPSAGLVSLMGQRAPGRTGLVGVAPVAGPLATSARANALIMQVVLEAELWRRDSMLNHFHWRGMTLSDRPLKVGIVEDDGQTTPTPPIRRTIQEVSEKLKNAGVEIVPLKLTNVEQDMGLLWTSFSLDGAKVSLFAMHLRLLVKLIRSRITSTQWTGPVNRWSTPYGRQVWLQCPKRTSMKYSISPLHASGRRKGTEKCGCVMAWTL